MSAALQPSIPGAPPGKQHREGWQKSSHGIGQHKGRDILTALKVPECEPISMVDSNLTQRLWATAHTRPWEEKGVKSVLCLGFASLLKLYFAVL